MNRFSIFYLLPLFCILFAPAHADREQVCKLASANVVNSDSRAASRTFNRGDIHLYKYYDVNSRRTSYQVEDNLGQKSAEFTINPRTAVFVDNEITIRSRNIYAYFTLGGDTSTFYRNEFSVGEFTKNFPVVRFTLHGRTLGITAIKAKKNGSMWIIMAVSGDTPRIVFPSQRVKSMSHNPAQKAMSFDIQADTNYPIDVEFDTLANANTFHEYVAS